jgi:fumarylpyruvate hydrolase
MTNFAIPLWDTPSIPVVNGNPFPVHRIFCVGRNYAAHAREMGHDPDRDPPFFFTKPANAVVANNTTTPYPDKTQDMHPEIEMVVALKSGGYRILKDQALDTVFGYCVGLDMTRRDMQSGFKDMGRPWDMAKGFDRSAPMSEIHTAASVGHISSGAITLAVNEESRQEGDINQLIWNIPETISYLSSLITLCPGDLIMTGTPSGVSAVVKGDHLIGHVDGLTDLDIRIG